MAKKKSGKPRKTSRSSPKSGPPSGPPTSKVTAAGGPTSKPGAPTRASRENAPADPSPLPVSSTILPKPLGRQASTRGSAKQAPVDAGGGAKVPVTARPSPAKSRAQSRGRASDVGTPSRRAARPAIDPPPPPPDSVEDAPDLAPGEPPVLGNIPWGYGDNRVVGMPVDPYWVFVYWEVTDEAIARARDAVRAAAGDCILRIYDTTYRLFDGTNANWSMDVPVYRPANNHYVLLNRPGSTCHVDLGVKSHAGDFATIVRSGPIEMPRNAVSPDSRVEWMTVNHEGSSAPPYEHQFSSRPAEAHVHDPGARPAPAEVESIMQALAGEAWSHTEWSETALGGRVARWIRWIGPGLRPVARLGEDGGLARVTIAFEGERRVIRLEGGERIVLGPWHVTISGLDPDGGHRTLDRWAIYYAWPTEAGSIRVETTPILHRILHAYRSRALHLGSEARVLAESWSSEALSAGASEWQWLGASELQLGGASELRFLGGSELRFLGASETLSLGASELRSLGASETFFVGASEWAGASEAPFPGASDLGRG